MNNTNEILFSADESVLLKFQNKNAITYTVPETVTEISESAFAYCDALEKIKICSSVKTIGKLAFYHCQNLISIQLTAGLESIEAGAFADCSKLATLDIPPSVTHIGDSNFYGCSSLEDITINELQNTSTYFSVKGILCNREKSTVICVPANKRGTVRFPLTITKLEDYAFYGCDKITEVQINESIQDITGKSFAMCTWLQKINVDPGNKYFCDVDGILYNKAKTRLIVFPGGRNREYTIPDGLNEFGDFCFFSVTNYKKTLVINNPKDRDIIKGFSVFNPKEE